MKENKKMSWMMEEGGTCFASITTREMGKRPN